jgi:hypothetical protein
MLIFARYRAKEYDTTRDPRGPLSAGAEVLYGVVSDFISGLATVPMDVAGVFSKDRYRKKHHHHHNRSNRDWVKPHVTACLDKAEQKKAERSATDNANEDRRHRPEGQDESLESATPENSTEGDEYASAEEEQSESSEDTAVEEADEIRNELDLERTLTRKRIKEQRTTTQQAISETGYHTSKFAKQVLNFVIMLPTDLTLSLAKGFHNAPKLYHDTTVRKIPRVLNMKSGFRAAGTVSAYPMNIVWASLLTA